MRNVEVVAAVIERDGKIFSTQRGYGSNKGGWEFPGGKIEKGETHKDALVREITEELNASIAVGDLLTTVEYQYPDMSITMHCYMCELTDPNIELLEHSDARWLTMDNIDSVDWLPADIGAVQELKRRFS